MGTPSQLTASQGLSLSVGNDAEAREDVGQDIEIVDELDRPITYPGPDGSPVPVVFTVVGTYSARHRKFVEQQEDALFQRGRRSQRKLRADIRRNVLEQAANAIVAWRGVLDTDGRPLACNHANALTLLSQKTWLRDQVMEAAQDHEGFLRSSSPTS